MEKFTLASDEGIVLRTQNVAYNSSTSFLHELVLTNKNIIVLLKGLFGGTKRVLYIPLDQIKIIDGKVQVLIGKHSNGTSRLEIYTVNGDVSYFSFNTITRIELTKWANTISKLLVNENEKGYDPSKYAIPGAEIVAESIKSTIDSVKNVFNKKTTQEINSMKRAVFCQNCGARYEGIRGSVGKCPYCGTVQNIS